MSLIQDTAAPAECRVVETQAIRLPCALASRQLGKTGPKWRGLTEHLKK